VTASVFKRIDAVEKEVHAYITLMRETALAEADAADEKIKRGESGPLTGIPIALKDIYCTKGVRTTCGSRILSNRDRCRSAETAGAGPRRGLPARAALAAAANDCACGRPRGGGRPGGKPCQPQARGSSTPVETRSLNNPGATRAGGRDVDPVKDGCQLLRSSHSRGAGSGWLRRSAVRAASATSATSRSPPCTPAPRSLAPRRWPSAGPPRSRRARPAP